MLWGLRVGLGTSDSLGWGESMSLGLTGLPSQALAFGSTLSASPPPPTHPTHPRGSHGRGLTSILVNFPEEKAWEYIPWGQPLFFSFNFSLFSVWGTRSQPPGQYRTMEPRLASNS